MLKRDEISDPQSCFNKARSDERVFVLLERDIAAPCAIREWAMKRVELGKNKATDPQIKEALNCADKMETGAEASGPQQKDPNCRRLYRCSTAVLHPIAKNQPRAGGRARD